jgi:hypothetical protein
MRFRSFCDIIHWHNLPTINFDPLGSVSSRCFRTR